MSASSPTDPWRPRWIPLLAALVLIALFIRLGVWQLSRADEKREIMAAAEAAPALVFQADMTQPERYAQLSVTGRFDTERHILLDNQVLKGRPGVHVWTPFKTDAGPWLLINRGWLPIAADRSLPVIETPSATLALSAQVNAAPRVGRKLGGQDQLKTNTWPQLVTYLDVAQISAAMDLPLRPWILQLAPESPGGFDGRQWSVVNFGPKKHLSYAWTWFSLAFTVALVTFLLQRPRRRQSSAINNPQTSSNKPPARSE
jgi:cytochrome oxidase assembly protein ShyY1